MELIGAYDKNGEYSVGHDVVYAGGPKSNPDNMTPEDRGHMKRLGWAWDDTEECWYRFV
jgi:hypothetical protein